MTAPTWEETVTAGKVFARLIDSKQPPEWASVAIEAGVITIEREDGRSFVVLVKEIAG